MWLRHRFSPFTNLVCNRTYRHVARQLQSLADQYRQKVEGLTALRYLWEVQMLYLRKPDAAAATLKRIRETIKKVPDEQFDGTTPERQRAAWEKWLTDAANVKAPPAATTTGTNTTPKRPG